MLTAVNHGRVTWARDANRQEKYCCPECQQRLILHQGKVKLAHFAHPAHSKCVMSEGETYEHLLGKQQIFEWARKLQLNPEIERYQNEIHQRADILLDHHQGPIAIEFQCSPLSLERHLERNAGYRQVGWRYYWILGSPYQRKLSRVKQAQFIHYLAGNYCLLYWDVNKQQLIKRFFQPTRANLSWQRQLKDLSGRHDPEIIEVQRQACQLGYRLEQCPAFCHLSQTELPVTNHHLLLWRIQLAIALEQQQLFQRWSLSAWQQFLASVGENEWTITPCLADRYHLAQQEWQVVTDCLQASDVIHISTNNVMLMKHPHWFKNLDEKARKLRQQQFTFKH